MAEGQIELRVEKLFDKRLMDGELDQATYNEEARKIDAWADEQDRKLGRSVMQSYEVWSRKGDKWSWSSLGVKHVSNTLLTLHNCKVDEIRVITRKEDRPIILANG